MFNLGKAYGAKVGLKLRLTKNHNIKNTQACRKDKDNRGIRGNVPVELIDRSLSECS